MASNKKRTASVICKALLFSSIHQSGLNMEKMSFIYVFYLIFSISFRVNIQGVLSTFLLARLVFLAIKKVGYGLFKAARYGNAARPTVLQQAAKSV